jgi:Leucine-rich repeat (LRR) protein
MPPPKFTAANVPLEVHVMTPEDVAECCGKDELETVEEIEVLFGNVTEIASLERCTSLRALTMINCNLRLLSGLAPVSMTLERLCLADQKLTRMEGLALPCLRELLLQQNQITSIQVCSCTRSLVFM